MSSSQPQQGHNQSSPQAAGASAYTPTPIRKSRSVTGTHAAIDPQSLPQQSHTPAPATPSAQAGFDERETLPQEPEIARPSSIQINLDTFGASNQETLEREQRAQAKLAEFAPLSAISYQTPAPTHEPAPQQSWESAADDPWSTATAEPSYDVDPYGSDYYSAKGAHNDLYRKRRRVLYLIVLIVLVSAWALAMLVQVGVERFVADPYGETMTALFGADPNPETLAPPPPETQVNIEKISAVASVSGVTQLDKRVYVVQGTLGNQGDSSLSAALLRVTLRQPLGAEVQWEQKAEFNCCQELNPLGLNKSERRDFIKQLRAGEVNQEGSLRLSSGRRQSFSIAIKLEDAIRLKRGETPRADVKVVFAE